MKVTLTTAIPLDKAQQSSMEKALLDRTKGQDVTFVYRVDETVLGGIKVTLGSRELDGTLRARLNQVEQQLTAHL